MAALLYTWIGVRGERSFEAGQAGCKHVSVGGDGRGIGRQGACGDAGRSRERCQGREISKDLVHTQVGGRNRRAGYVGVRAFVAQQDFDMHAPEPRPRVCASENGTLLFVGRNETAFFCDAGDRNRSSSREKGKSSKKV